jgi:hypothetical protein
MFRLWIKTRQTRRISELEAECDLLRRQLKVSEAERESLSLVIARDRERIKSELAAYAKATAAGEKQ